MASQGSEESQKGSTRRNVRFERAEVLLIARSYYEHRGSFEEVVSEIKDNDHMLSQNLQNLYATESIRKLKQRVRDKFQRLMASREQVNDLEIRRHLDAIAMRERRLVASTIPITSTSTQTARFVLPSSSSSSSSSSRAPIFTQTSRPADVRPMTRTTWVLSSGTESVTPSTSGLSVQLLRPNSSQTATQQHSSDGSRIISTPATTSRSHPVSETSSQIATQPQSTEGSRITSTPATTSRSHPASETSTRENLNQRVRRHIEEANAALEQSSEDEQDDPRINMQRRIAREIEVPRRQRHRNTRDLIRQNEKLKNKMLKFFWKHRREMFAVSDTTDSDSEN